MCYIVYFPDTITKHNNTRGAKIEDAVPTIDKAVPLLVLRYWAPRPSLCTKLIVIAVPSVLKIYYHAEKET